MIIEIETDTYLKSLRKAYFCIKKINIPIRNENLDMIMARSTAIANLFSTIKTIESKIEARKKDIEEMNELFRKEKV